jgi:Putative heavy-metal-binding
MFTSRLSVNEFALLDRLGPSPLAQVMGASVVQAGWQYLPPLDPGKLFISGSLYAPTPTGRALTNPYTEPSLAQLRNYRWHTEVVCELDVLTDAWNLARRRALERLREEASQVGADAVVGVHLRHSDHDLGKGTIECLVSGTAVRLPRSPGAAWPALSALSVQDYWRLHDTGHEPVGLLATTIAVFASPARATRVRRARTISQNQELSELSRGFQVARETVRAKLRGQISDAGGTGAVGVEFSHSVERGKFALASSLQTIDRRGWHTGRFGLPYRVTGASEVDRRGWVITMHATGTAIRDTETGSRYPVKATVRIGAG